MEQLGGFGTEIRAGDLDPFAEIFRGDLLDESVGGLVVVFRDLAMAFLMFDDVWGYADGHPDVDIELQRHIDLGDGDSRVCGICPVRLPADSGVGHEIGVAHGDFPGSEGWYIGRRRGWVKGAVHESNGQLVDCRHERFPELRSR